MQGDIVAIHDAAGNVVATYDYDAWGNQLTAQTQGSIGELNPIRYRGYYYDTETKLYYLQSRYYNSEWGRFISADVYCDTQDGILSTNMYAYCQNDPVNAVDPSGMALRPFEIHNAVQADIRFHNRQISWVPTEKWIAWTIYGGVDENGNIISTSGLGRIDLISYDGQIWEVKPGKSKAGEFVYMMQGLLQLSNYTAAYLGENYGGLLKPAGISEPLRIGTTPIKKGEFTYRGEYLVNYWDIGGGLIMYDYTKIGQKQSKYQFNPQPAIDVLKAILPFLPFLFLPIGGRAKQEVYA